MKPCILCGESARERPCNDETRMWLCDRCALQCAERELAMAEHGDSCGWAELCRDAAARGLDNPGNRVYHMRGEQERRLSE